MDDVELLFEIQPRADDAFRRADADQQLANRQLHIRDSRRSSAFILFSLARDPISFRKCFSGCRQSAASICCTISLPFGVSCNSLVFTTATSPSATANRNARSRPGS